MKSVYYFGKNNSDGQADMKNLLGGKGANLAEMAKLGIPVPAALNPIIGSFILLSHNFLNFSASLSFFENLDGIGLIVLFFRKALTILSDVFSIRDFIVLIYN